MFSLGLYIRLVSSISPAPKRRRCQRRAGWLALTSRQSALPRSPGPGGRTGSSRCGPQQRWPPGTPRRLAGGPCSWGR